jgi:hypothetical protein
MEHSALQSFKLAQVYLKESLESCQTDPAVYNELGVVYYHQNKYFLLKKLSASRFKFQKNLKVG